MSKTFTYHFLRRSFAVLAIYFGVFFPATYALAQSEAAPSNVDPRLIEIVEIVKSRTAANPDSDAPVSDAETIDEIYLALIDRMDTAFFSRKAPEILSAVANFEDSYRSNSALSLDAVPEVYTIYAASLSDGASSSDIRASLVDFTTQGNWFERYIALSVLAHTHATAQERQAALQKAQLALAIIPSKPDPRNGIYVEYANKHIKALIAHLYNLQGNSDLALSVSLDYLRSTEGDTDPKAAVDLINNLIYSYSLARDHDAQIYLSQQLLEIEKNQSSSVAGLSEMRIAGVMNSSGRYLNGLDYAKRSVEKASNPTVLRVARVNEAIALAGLGELDEARKIAGLAGVDLSRDHMLTEETGKSNLYLAFILAQAEDPKYATRLYNRQLDVKAQAFLANNSRDTTAMLAELENSHERQSEREAAAARESQLQALTIQRQRNLNRALMGVLLLMGLALLAGVLFIRYRGKVLRKLEIKTLEAASAEKLKTEFLGMISHELRTPLNGIIGISDFLANYHEDPDIRKKTGIVLRSGNELLAVVESLTDMARLDAGQLDLLPHDADLSKSLASVPELWTEKAQQKGLTFTNFVDPKITEHHLDEDRLIQCLNILLANAISFTDSGRVHLHITGQDSGAGGVTGLTAIVADTGQGMSELVQSRLFKPFMQADTSRRRSHMGTGLSLAIAYALVEMMGGRLSVNSREGRGSEFQLDIPLAAPTHKTIQADPPVTEISEDIKSQTAGTAQLSSTSDSPSRDLPVLDAPMPETAVSDGSDGPQSELLDLMQPPAGLPGLHGVKKLTLPGPAEGRQRILVVDDMSANREVIRLIVESQGHRCTEAADGFAALAAIDRQTFDFIVLDIHMTPMDGVETLRRIRRSGKPYANIPVIALTADNAAGTNAACMEAGADLFLTKPVSKDELLSAISYLNQTDGARILSQ